jgi:hypothetical protein
MLNAAVVELKTWRTYIAGSGMKLIRTTTLRDEIGHLIQIPARCAQTYDRL